MKLVGRWLAAFVIASWPGPLWAAELNSSALGNIFLEGQAPRFTLRAPGETARWQARDFFGNTVAAGNIVLTGGTATFRPQISRLGYFKLDIFVDRETAPQIQTALAVLPTPPPPSRNSPFGVMTHFAKGWSTDIVPLIGKAGIARIRDEQPWRQVEREPGRYQFPPRLNGFMTELAANNIDPLIVLAFSNPHYNNDKTPFDDSGRAAYGAYAAAAAQRYPDQLSAVEVWNEYNGSFCDGPCRGDRPAYYTAMLKQAYKALKAANPALVVAGGAAVHIPLDYFDRLFRGGALDAMDAVVIHPYRKIPEGVEEKIAALRQMMARYGKPKPIWATEFGDTANMKKNRDDVARYLVRMSTLLLASGTERIYWYLLKDYQEFSGMGLLLAESDPAGRYVPAPAYPAYANLIHQLDGAKFVRREKSESQVRVYLFSRGGREIRVAWSTVDREKFDIHGDAALRQFDMMGNAKILQPQRGIVSVFLDRNPIYLTNGG